MKLLKQTIGGEVDFKLCSNNVLWNFCKKGEIRDKPDMDHGVTVESRYFEDSS